MCSGGDLFFIDAIILTSLMKMCFSCLNRTSNNVLVG